MATLTGNVLGAIANVTGPDDGDDVNAYSVNTLGQGLIDNDATLNALKYDKTGGTISGNATVTGNLTVNGNSTLGNSGSDTTTLSGNLNVPDSDSIKINTPSGVSRTVVADVTFIYGTGWAMGTNGSANDGASETTPPPVSAPGNSMCLRFNNIPHGCKVTSLTVYIDPPTHGSLPGGMPKISSYIFDVPTDTETSIATQTDTSASVGAYEAYHGITLADPTGSNHVWDAASDVLYVKFESHYGNGSIPIGMRVAGATITRTILSLAL